jgi:hypothetical protein
MALYGFLPQYKSPDPLDFSPLANGLNALGGYMGRQEKDAKFNSLFDDPAKMASLGINPAMVDVAKVMGYEQGPNALMGAYQAEQQRKLALSDRGLRERQLAEQARMHDQTLALQRLQEQRLQGSMQSEIDLRRAQADSARQQADNARTDSELMRSLMGPGPQPQSPMAAPPMPPAAGPQGPLPGPAMNSPLPGPAMPQSSDGFDPAMVRPMSDAGPAPQPQQPMLPGADDPRLVDTPFRRMSIDRARQLAGVFALRGKNEAAKLMQSAIEAKGLGKPGQNELDKKAVDTGELAMRLDGIMMKFRPEYQTLGTQLKMYGADTADWLGMSERVPAGMRQQLAYYTAFRQDAMNNLSQYIKEVTGAAMGIQEEKRIRAGMPDPERDGPTKFEAKMRNAVGQAKYALARYNYLMKQGYDPAALSANREKLSSMIKIEDMPRVINERGAALKQQISSQGVPPAEVDRAVLRQLKQEFGI